MYKEGQKFLEDWCNDTKNDGYENELKEYGEKEVEDMLFEYRRKFSLSVVGVRSEQFICHDEDTYGKGARCSKMCVPCRGFNK